MSIPSVGTLSAASQIAIDSNLCWPYQWSSETSIVTKQSPKVSSIVITASSSSFVKLKSITLAKYLAKFKSVA